MTQTLKSSPGKSTNKAVPQNAGRLLLLASVFSSALADWLVLLFLGSSTVFLGPDSLGSAQGMFASGAALIYIPVYIFMMLSGLVADKLSGPSGRFEARPFRGLDLAGIDLAKIARLLFVLLMMSEAFRLHFLSDPKGPQAFICLFLLASNWSSIHLFKRIRNKNLTAASVGALVAAYGLGQTAALKLAPSLSFFYPGNLLVATTACLYALALALAAYCDYADKKVALSLMPEAQAQETVTTSGTAPGKALYASQLRAAFANALLSLPAMSLLIATSLFSLEGLTSGDSSVPLSEIASKLTFSFAFGALLSPVFEVQLHERKVWLGCMLLNLSLLLAGAMTHNLALAYFSLMLSSALTGGIVVVEETHFLRNLARHPSALVLAVRNAHLLLLVGLATIPVEKSIPVVSTLYLIKEFNLLASVFSVVAICALPLLYYFGTGKQKNHPHS